MSKKVITLIQTLTLSFLPLLLNGFNVSLSIHPHSISNHQVEPIDSSIYEVWFDEVRKVIKESEKSEIPFEVKTVVIDAGHGGHDPGCSGAHSREKHIALAISKKLAQLMQERMPGLRVILTRDKDVFIPLQERAAIANRNNADMFISIHCNYMPGSSATRGSETYVMGLHTADENLEVAKRENAAILHEDNYQQTYGGYDPNSPEGHIMLSMFQNAFLDQSILLANKVEKRFAEAERKSRGVKQAGFLVLRETAMPSILIEAGFLSSRREEAYLKTAVGQEVIANAILEAFVEYKYEIEGGQITTAPALASGSIQERKGVRPLQTSNSIQYDEPKTVEKKVLVEQPIKSAPAQAHTQQFRSASQPTTAHPLDTKPNFDRPAVKVEPEPMVISKTPQANTTHPQGRSYHSTDEKASYTLPSTQTKRAPIPPATNISKTAAPSSNRPPTTSERARQQNIRFCVQLAASPKPLSTGTAKWQQVSYRIEVIQENRLFKYQARHFLNFQQAFAAKLQVQKQGFKDAFIVAYKDGKKVPLQEARQELGQ